MKRYFFSTGLGKYFIDAGTLHTALHRLGEILEYPTSSIIFTKNGDYKFCIVLDKVANKGTVIGGYR